MKKYAMLLVISVLSTMTAMAKDIEPGIYVGNVSGFFAKDKCQLTVKNTIKDGRQTTSYAMKILDPTGQSYANTIGSSCRYVSNKQKLYSENQCIYSDSFTSNIRDYSIVMNGENILVITGSEKGPLVKRYLGIQYYNSDDLAPQYVTWTQTIKEFSALMGTQKPIHCAFTDLCGLMEIEYKCQDFQKIK